MKPTALLVFALLLPFGGSVAAQDVLVGTWQVTYPAGARVDNGVQRAIMGTGTLRIESVGDSLIGQLTPDAVAELPARGPTRLAGLAANGSTALVTVLSTLVEVDGQQRAVTVRSTWQLEAKGESLAGTLSHYVEGVDGMAQEPGPVQGTRVPTR